MPESDQKERRIQNERVFRKLNQEYEASLREHVAAAELADETLNYICECSRATCDEPLMISMRKFHELHRRESDFVVKPGHEQLDIESVVLETPNYLVVQKTALQ